VGGVKLLAIYKESKANAILGALLLVVALCLALLQAAPAKAAASFCCTGVFVVGADPSSATLNATSGATTAQEIAVVVTTPSAAGSSQAVFVERTEPATPETDPTTPELVTQWKGSFGPYNVPAGATITATLGGVLLDSYTNTTPPPVVVPPANQQAVPPQVTFNDAPGVGNDTITLPAGTGFANPVINGVSYLPNTYNVHTSQLVDGKGCVTYSYAVLDGFTYKGGASFGGTTCFRDATPPVPPADNTDIESVPICHATGSDTNPFVQLPGVSPNSILKEAGHAAHQDGQDKIPPFDYVSHGVAGHFPGQNWDQAFYENGCATVVVNPDPEPETQPEPDPEPAPEPDANPAPAPAPAPASAPAPNPAPAGHTVPQVQAQIQVQSEVPTEQEEGVVSMTADTAAGSSTQGYTVPLLIALAGLLVWLAPVLLRRRPDEETAQQ
jgi:hypothetical protein